MNFKRFIIFKIFIYSTLFVLFACSSKNELNNGLIGIYYSEPNLTSIKALTVLKALDQVWDESVDFQGGSSGEWNGYILAPTDGLITFHFSTDQIAKLVINNDSLKLGKDNPNGKLAIETKKGESYPKNHQCRFGCPGSGTGGNG